MRISDPPVRITAENSLVGAWAIGVIEKNSAILFALSRLPPINPLLQVVQRGIPQAAEESPLSPPTTNAKRGAPPEATDHPFNHPAALVAYSHSLDRPL